MAVDITNHLIPWAIAKRMQADAWDEGMEAGQRAVILKQYTQNNPYRDDA